MADTAYKANPLLKQRGVAIEYTKEQVKEFIRVWDALDPSELPKFTVQFKQLTDELAVLDPQRRAQARKGPVSGLIIQGDNDEIVNETDVALFANKLDSQRSISIKYKKVKSADHFFTNFEGEMIEAVNEYLSTRSDL